MEFAEFFGELVNDERHYDETKGDQVPEKGGRCQGAEKDPREKGNREIEETVNLKIKITLFSTR